MEFPKVYAPGIWQEDLWNGPIWISNLGRFAVTTYTAFDFCESYNFLNGQIPNEAAYIQLINYGGLVSIDESNRKLNSNEL